MSFQRFLNEGLIKIPYKLQHVAEEFFKTNVLAYVAYRALKQAGRDKAQQEYVLLALKRAAASLRIALPDAQEIAKAGNHKALSIRIPLGEIDRRYLDRLEKKYDHLTRHGIEVMLSRYKIKFTVAFGKYADIGTQAGNYREGPGIEPEVIISIPNLKLDMHLDRHFNAAQAARRIKDGLESIEHELTHAMQFRVLGKLHSDQTKGVSVNGGDRSDKYFQDPSEFDPQIKTSIRHFRSQVEAAKATADFKKTRQLFDGWVEKSEFLNSLKKTSKPKWQKAIKYIWTEYEKRFI